MRTVLATLVAAAAVGFAAPAQAYGPTTAQSLAIADRTLPAHACTGKMQVVRDDAFLDAHGGLQGAVVLYRGEQGWYSDGCVMFIRTGMHLEIECKTIHHEAKHFVYGPEHEGPLHPSVPDTAECDKYRPSARDELLSEIRATLPQPAAWRVSCTPTSRHMRCKATRSGFRVRRYTASIHGSNLTWGAVKRTGSLRQARSTRGR